MVLLGNFLFGLGGVIQSLLFFFYILLFGNFILSWVNPDPMNPIVRFVFGCTEPVLNRIRRYVRPIGMFDISIIVAFAALYFLDVFIAGSLKTYGLRLNPMLPQVL